MNYFFSISNSEKTNLSVEEQGIHFSNEVLDYLEENGFEKEGLKISFIGHSLGGIVIR